MARDARGAGVEARQIPALEWLVAGIGALLVAGAIGYLVYHALWRDQTPPDVRIVVQRVLALEGHHLVEFRAVNRGGEPAAQLLIEGELVGPDGPVEAAEATLDHLAPGSHRDGGLFFRHDPREFELRLHAKGYVIP
jgi:uncharacterized protein (TIGR02588 family)